MVDECGWVMADYGRSDFSEWFIGGLRWLWSYSAFLWEMMSGVGGCR